MRVQAVRVRKLAGNSVLLALLLGTLVPATLQAPSDDEAPPPAGSTAELPLDIEVEPGKPNVAEGEREATLGPDWQEKNDLAWNVAGDSQGVSVHVAASADGYDWRTIAKLGSNGIDTDRWIANACLAADQESLVVVYGPRQIANNPESFGHGAFASVVNLNTGDTTQLEGGFSISYSNPSCGVNDRAVLVQQSEEHKRTRLVSFRPSNPGEVAIVETESAFSSVIPTANGLVGASGSSIVQIDESGQTHPLTEASGQVFSLAETPNGSLAYMQHDGTRSQAIFLDSGSNTDAATTLAEAELGELDIVSSASGTLILTGTPDDVVDQVPEDVQILAGTDVFSIASSEGALVSQPGFASSAALGAIAAPGDDAGLVNFESAVTQTGEILSFSTEDAGAPMSFAEGNIEADENVDTAATVQSREDLIQPASMTRENNVVFASSPISSGTCAVDRNDPTIQAYQPRPVEVEWAVNRAVRQTLDPDFPLPSLSGGGRVPAQVMLGVLAQESNFWQASRYTMPGVTGNPLVGNFYGTDTSGASNWWTINYSDSDCGYGIAQVTDGMTAGEMPYSLQKKLAIDYQANISRGLQILIEKWNQAYSGGLKINDGDPKYIENWFYALWAYNTGMKPGPASSASSVSVGWFNNPANPIYSPIRPPFLDGAPEHAATPQKWPYPERVLGFAAHSVQFLDSVDQGPLGDTFNYQPAYNPSWWAASDGNDGKTNRKRVKPPIFLFCDASNHCIPSSPVANPVVNPCGHPNYECWYAKPATWKTDCAAQCGHEFLRYTLTDPKPAAGNGYPPNCSLSGLPSNALVVDNLPSGTPSQRGGCSPMPSAGSFDFSFAGEQAKVDLHQLGSGFNGQFFFSHTRVPGTTAAYGGALNISGTWTLGQALNSWAQVYVHMPSHGAWLQQANYVVDQGGGVSTTRSVSQRNYANKWVSLGALKFNGVPKVSLSNFSSKYSKFGDALSGVDDIAWDAVAFVPLAEKPKEFVVALGDSFSSGEGTSARDGSEFVRSSDHNGSPDPGDEESPFRNACHRSLNAWPYGVDSPNIPGNATARELIAAGDTRIDFHMLACSGALTENVKSYPGAPQSQMYAESNQLDRGFLDSNTTLVTLSIGGNDLGFSPILSGCIQNTVLMIGLPGEEGYDSSLPLFRCENLTSPEGGTMQEMVDAHLAALPGQVSEVLQQIKAKAPNAKIVMLGYPPLFETGSECIFIQDGNRAWLNKLASRLNATLTAAAENSGTNVTYQTPEHRFRGANLCANNSGINGLVLDLTPGDQPMFKIPIPGEDYPVGVSAQSIHPNARGAEMYSAAANDAISETKVPLSATIVGGAPTTYYGTFRFHNGEGPVLMNVSSFPTCGKELRIGLRKNDANSSGVVNQQHTDTLSWTEAQSKQAFKWSGAGATSATLPAGWYALNARLVNNCSGGAAQPWEGSLYW